VEIREVDAAVYDVQTVDGRSSSRVKERTLQTAFYGVCRGPAQSPGALSPRLLSPPAIMRIDDFSSAPRRHSIEFEGGSFSLIQSMNMAGTLVKSRRSAPQSKQTHRQNRRSTENPANVMER